MPSPPAAQQPQPPQPPQTPKSPKPQGAECFSFFSQSGLDKVALRDIWTLVAGTSGSLSGPQFVAYLYLIDLVKRGMPMPTALPPGLAGFPPVAGAPAPLAAAAPPLAPPGAAGAAPGHGATWSLQSQFGTSNNITAVLAAPAPSNMAAPPPPAAMPTRLDPSALPPVSLPPPHASAVPPVPASLLAGVSAMDR